ncbi:hypothetical protein HBI56_133970 [Parastagonospora nodorum]|nr:hypothetical protein HBI09_034430 [Parastagonospora nodorum]KAH4815933.1 hypothetical protein HBH61_059310 [Parastagonospora nodorum]KAH4948986.1 hypothetical protein HBH74_034470 [Parastagonospora nodorum]KAH4982761.1 hypothetical protein HBH73_030770 [Parastagonospora nodorum]KAH4998819.1 hypothetical protein HBI77_182140 [Parastagonospora nodorum]
MATARNAFAGHVIVELSSDSEEEGALVDFSDFSDTDEEPQDPNAHLPADQDPDHLIRELNARYNPVYEAADGIIDLTGIPDIDVPPSDPLLADRESPAQDCAGSDKDLVTEAVALQMVIDILPDISIDHVLGIIREKTTDLTRTNARCHEIVSQLVDTGDYPKEDEDTKSKKRKRSDEDDWQEYDKAERDLETPTYELNATELLKDEFLSVPVRHVVNVVKEHKTLFKSYIVLEEQTRNYETISRNRFSRIGKARNKRGTENLLIEQGSQLPKELHAVKKKIEVEMGKRRKAEQAEKAEVDNRQRAEASGRMGECACCFDDVPLNRMISCNGDPAHFYCMECPKRQIETQMGLSNCRPKCFGVDNCAGTFARKDLQQVLGDKTFERLEHLQQQEDLAAAGLDFLSECPFCDYKMECLPVEVDKEFRCQNKKCGKTSCRLCEKETHIPLTCKEADKDGQITLRHIVEEAMSAALIRQCNKCKHPFVKEYGCNKMRCSHCRNVQCYVCSKNVTNYEHFGEVGRGRCPLHENVEDRHEQEVKKAADDAMAKVRADNPSLSDADLMIKVSDRVKQAEDARKGRAQVQANAFPYHMIGDHLQHLVEPPLPPPFRQPGAPDRPVAQPAGFGYNILPMNRLGNALGQQAQLAQEPNLRAQQPPPPPPQQPRPFYEFMQDPLPRAGQAQLDANHVNQRLEELRNRQLQLQQQRAQLAMQRRLRLMNLQQENLARQRELLLQDDDGAAMRNLRAVRDHLEEAMRAQPRPRHG